MIEKENIGRIILGLREKNFKSQAEFLKAYQQRHKEGLKQTTYSNWERGLAEPSVSMAYKIAAVLGVTMYDLIGKGVDKEQDSSVSPDTMPYPVLKEKYVIAVSELKRLRRNIKQVEGGFGEIVKALNNTDD